MLLTILLISLLVRKLNQPYFVAYILAGIILGPWGIGMFKSTEAIGGIGDLGLIIQMFFVGTEIEVPLLMNQIKKLLIGVFVQVLLSFICVLLLGMHLSWGFTNVLLFSFVISLSSSAIIHEYLFKNNELHSPLGVLTTGILILQDFLVVVMLLVVNFLGKGGLSMYELLPQLGGTLLIFYFLRRIVIKRKINLPFPNQIQKDHELQVFVGLLICFGFASVTSLLNLSAAFGSMIAGILIAHSNSTQWLQAKLVPFRVFFLALFFLSMGLQINLYFLLRHVGLVLIIVVFILIINSVINAFVFRLLKESMRNSIYAGAMLSQIGEYSLVLCIIAKGMNIVDEYWFQLTLAVISATMLFTSVWISIIRAFIYQQPSNLRKAWIATFLAFKKSRSK
jgi:CPA2 family monovalent cation:H+ antiporter-2